MAETALAQLSILSKLDKKQMKFLDKQLRRENLKYYSGEMFGVAKTVLTNPIVLLVGGFIAIDYLEKHEWTPGKEPLDTMLGGAAANTLRGAIAAGAVMNALGTSGVASAIGDVARAGGEAGGALLPLLAATAIPGVPPPP